MELKKPKDKGIVEVCARNTMYPSYGFILKNHKAVFGAAQLAAYSTLYGYAFDDTRIQVDGHTFTLRAKEYIGVPVRKKLMFIRKACFSALSVWGFRDSKSKAASKKRGA